MTLQKPSPMASSLHSTVPNGSLRWSSLQDKTPSMVPVQLRLHDGLANKSSVKSVDLRGCSNPELPYLYQRMRLKSTTFFKSIPGIAQTQILLQDLTLLHSSQHFLFSYRLIIKEGSVLDRSFMEFFVYSPESSPNRPIDNACLLSRQSFNFWIEVIHRIHRSRLTRCRYRKNLGMDRTTFCQHNSAPTTRTSTIKHPLYQNPLSHCTTPRQYPYTDAPCFISR